MMFHKEMLHTDGTTNEIYQDVKDYRAVKELKVNVMWLASEIETSTECQTAEHIGLRRQTGTHRAQKTERNI